MSRQSVINLTNQMWFDVKEKMEKDSYQYSTLEEAKFHYDLLERMYQAFEYNSQHKEFYLTSSYSLTRVVAEDSCDVDRIIPKPEYSRLNRMNPKDKFYAYYVIGYMNQDHRSRLRTGIFETRTSSRAYISTAEFYATKKLKLAKFVTDSRLNITYEENMFQQDMLEILSCYRLHGGTKGKEEAAQFYSYEIFRKVLIDGGIFSPVDGTGTERYYDYAPFHLIADYFEQKGYDGIIYPSSVDSEGYCVAIFDPSKVQADDLSLRCNVSVKDMLS